MIAHWRARYLEGAGGSLPKQLLVVEGSGRIAKQLQDEFPDSTVTAVDDALHQKSGPLKALRHRQAFPVNETMFNAATLRFLFGGDTFDAVVVPFVFHRLCGRDDQKLLRLLEECCRVARSWVLLADNEVVEDTGAFERWKAFLISQSGLDVVYSGQLNGGDVNDHFLSPTAGGGCPRQYILLRAFQTSRGEGFEAIKPGDTVEILTARRNWRPATITAVVDGKAKVVYSVHPHRVEEEVSLSAGHVRKLMVSPAHAVARGAVPVESQPPKNADIDRTLPLIQEAPLLDSPADDLVAGVLDVAMWLTKDEDLEETQTQPEEPATEGAQEVQLQPEEPVVETRVSKETDTDGREHKESEPDAPKDIEPIVGTPQDAEPERKSYDYSGNMREFIDTAE